MQFCARDRNQSNSFLIQFAHRLSIDYLFLWRAQLQKSLHSFQSTIFFLSGTWWQTIPERLQRVFIIHLLTIRCGAYSIETEDAMTRQFLMHASVLLFLWGLQNASPLLLTLTLRNHDIRCLNPLWEAAKTTQNVLTLLVQCICILWASLHAHTSNMDVIYFVRSSNFNIHWIVGGFNFTALCKYVGKLHNTSHCFALHTSLNVLI